MVGELCDCLARDYRWQRRDGAGPDGLNSVEHRVSRMAIAENQIDFFAQSKAIGRSWYAHLSARPHDPMATLTEGGEAASLSCHASQRHFCARSVISLLWQSRCLSANSRRISTCSIADHRLIDAPIAVDIGSSRTAHSAKHFGQPLALPRRSHHIVRSVALEDT